MKKLISIISIMMFILVLVVGCSAQEKPEDTVSEFIEAMKDFDFEVMASKVNPENNEFEDEVFDLYENTDDPFEKLFIDYVENNAKKITYKINESEIDGDKAVVNVDFKYVDGGPLFKATFEEYMKEVFGLAFSGEELTDEENSEIFIAAMEEQSKVIEETFAEEKLDIDCVKIEDEWYINEIDDELLDVAMSNMMTVIEEMDEAFDFGEEDSEESSLDIGEIEEEMNLIEKGVGDEIELNTINFKVTKVEETKKLTSEYSEEVLAKEGTKFVLVSMDITNTTKSEIMFPDDFKLIDDQEREFNTYSDTIGSIDDYLEVQDLAPSIKEQGRLVYEVPEDVTNYYTLMRKAETDDVYKVILK